MHIKHQITVIYLLLYFLLKTSCKKDDLFGPRIVGGEVCEYEDYPFAVAIFSNSICGGVIISLQWVLTAAHCISFSFVRDGKTLLRTGFNYNQRFVQKRYAKLAIRHENFDEELMSSIEHPELRYDIALILSNKPFQEGKYLKSALLPKPGSAGSCKVAVAIGVGRTQPELPNTYIFDKNMEVDNPKLNRTLYCAELPIVDTEICKGTWPTSVIDSSIVCTGVEEDRRDACTGDSGGGLYCGKTVIGIVSAGRGCAIPNMSATFTKVEAYLDFIEKTMKENTADRVITDWARGLIVIVIVLKMFFIN